MGTALLHSVLGLHLTYRFLDILSSYIHLVYLFTYNPSFKNAWQACAKMLDSCPPKMDMAPLSMPTHINLGVLFKVPHIYVTDVQLYMHTCVWQCVWGTLTQAQLTDI